MPRPIAHMVDSFASLAPKQGEIYYKIPPSQQPHKKMPIEYTFIGVDHVLRHGTETISLMKNKSIDERVVSKLTKLFVFHKTLQEYREGLVKTGKTEKERLSSIGMQQLKLILDDELQTPKDTNQVGWLLTPNLPGISNPSDVPVVIEQHSGRVLVKVGPPCDVSRYDKAEQEAIIKNIVEQGLKKANIHQKYKDVYVSASVGVKGLLQFSGINYSPITGGNHANGFIKCANESHLTLWEPRKGPQIYTNDTICAMTITMATAQFEHGVRHGVWENAKQATKQTLTHPRMNEVFQDIQDYRLKKDHSFLVRVFDAILNIIRAFKNQFNHSNDGTETVPIKQDLEHATTRYKETLSQYKDQLEQSDDPNNLEI